MRIMDCIHETRVRGRRIDVLARHLAARIPAQARVLDVGSGSGEIARRVQDARADISVRCIDVLIRPDSAMPVEEYGGERFPAETNGYDVVMFVDVLHHTRNAPCLLREATRVARQRVLIKDHLREGLLAGPILTFMDQVGNRRFGVDIVRDYRTTGQWRSAFAEAGLDIAHWQTDLNLYPWPAKLLFERSMHFLADLRPRA